MFGEKRSLRGNRVFITGVGRRINDMPGIGERLAYALVEKGAKVFITGVERHELTRVAAKCNAIGMQAGTGGHAYCTYCDVRDLKQVKDAVNMAVGRMGGLDTFVANAGVAKFLVIEDGDSDLFMQHVNVNFVGVYNTIHACAPHIKHKDGYGLVNASQGGIVALPGMAPGYGATKAAVIKLGEGYNLELVGTGARCGVLCMAEHESPMEEEFKEPIPRALMRDNPLLRKSHKARNPEDAIRAIVCGIERRSLYIDVPRYAALARCFPAITNFFARGMVRNPQRAMALARDEVAASKETID